MTDHTNGMNVETDDTDRLLEHLEMVGSIGEEEYGTSEEVREERRELGRKMAHLPD